MSLSAPARRELRAAIPNIAMNCDDLLRIAVNSMRKLLLSLIDDDFSQPSEFFFGGSPLILESPHHGAAHRATQQRFNPTTEPPQVVGSISASPSVFRFLPK